MFGTGASNFVEGVDKTFFIIIGIGALFLIGLTMLMLIFMIKYNKKRHPIAVQVKERMSLELTWVIIPLIIVLLMFYYGYIAYKPMREVPEGALNIKAIAKMWDFSFEYENGKESNTLVVPFNKPIKLNLFSKDIVHSFYVPAFRIKEDMVPGLKDNFMWFIPTELGKFDIMCAEYCGVRHSYMMSSVEVIPEAEYNSWITQIKKKSMKEEMKGFEILKNNACTGCHSTDGSKLVGPTFKEMFGSDVTVITEDGKEQTVKIDEEYIKNSILTPDKQVVKGFNKGLMRPYNEILKDEDIKEIIEYFKTPDED
ncbi:MAG: cytochrome c oxidase subunit II [Bacteroidetes bacterium GWA2_30_7]|nr:MAG: cytochrome c oxidase subunit II [Bacteroidetes bacterium GWA2_30_7]